jgi:putative SOS response-associated peptidase YedK
MIPASGYFEWVAIELPGQKKPIKQPYDVSRADGTPWSFAGLFERWGPEDLLTFSILTQSAEPAIAPSQPVILADDAAEGWIEGGAIERLNDLDDLVRIWSVTPKMNNARYEGADAIEPLADQSGSPL